MKQFLVLFNAPSATMREMMEKSSPEQHKASMDKWKEWMGSNATSFAFGGAPVGKNSRVTADGSEEVSNEIGGYSVMQGESKEAVVEILKTSPHFTEMSGSYVEVMEVMAMPS